MARALVLLAVALLVAYALARSLLWLRARLGELLVGGPAARATGRRRPSAGVLVPCAGCGVHVPRAQALAAGAAGGGTGKAVRFYCSEACRRTARDA